jgi:hypothetical protein
MKNQYVADASDQSSYQFAFKKRFFPYLFSAGRFSGGLNCLSDLNLFSAGALYGLKRPIFESESV